MASSPGLSPGKAYGPMKTRPAPTFVGKGLIPAKPSPQKNALKALAGRYQPATPFNAPLPVSGASSASPSGPSLLPFGVQNQATHLKSQAYGAADDTIAGLNDQQNQALMGAGYNASFDPAGNLSGLTFDPTNPFSRAALLKRSYDQAQQTTNTSMAAAGQLYSGANQRAHNQNTFGYQQGSDALQGGLTATLREIIRRRLAAKTGANNAATNIDDNAVIRAVGGAT